MTLDDVAEIVRKEFDGKGRNLAVARAVERSAADLLNLDDYGEPYQVRATWVKDRWQVDIEAPTNSEIVKAMRKMGAKVIAATKIEKRG